MNKSLFFAAILILTGCSSARWPEEAYIKKHNYQEIDHRIDTLVDKKLIKFPMFPGGSGGVNKFISANLQYSKEVMMRGVSGLVVLRCTIGVNGYIDQIEVIRSVDPLLDEEAIRVIRSMPRWIPGCEDGKPVCFRYLIPITFSSGYIEEAGRPLTWVTPCKRSAARGKEVFSKPRTPKEFNPLRGWGDCEWQYYPALRSACTGLSTFKAFRPFTFLTLSINHKLKMETAYCG
jgi:TonB family protein